MPPLRWLHDHADDWRAAITALTTTVGHDAGVPLDRDQRCSVFTREDRAAGEDWHSRIGTQEIVRSLLARLRRSPYGIADVLDRLEALLAEHDAASDQG
ncbi:hypothetical protein [Saccharopolyspora rosea]|uniref:Uncharacterized protein n=1 Tax=Saccharopolyspora rosea TaxID=524884 RepID=A0ABW3G419_9PSEU|nr:hypothetical protein [Saccharopolyspora rosea]